MNPFLIIAFLLAGGTIAVNRFRPLQHALAVVLYSAAVVLFVTGMILSRKAGS